MGPMRATVPIDGTVDARFASVRDAFRENFTSHNELGGAVCVVVEGTVVVDLWGGYRDLDGTLPWQRDTLVDVFSVGKGLLAAGVARLVGQGAIDLDAPIASVWPEFAANDKGHVTLRHVLSHAAGLPSVQRRLAPGAMLSPELMRGALAGQAPWWAPGTAHGYHVNTFGFLVGAVVERVTGRSIGAYLRDEVTGPIGADFHVGLAGADLDRVAEFRWALDVPPEVEPEGLEGLELMRYNAYWNPSGLSGLGVVNTEAWRRAEHPSTNAHATARGVTRLYDALARGGSVDGYELVAPDALRGARTECVVGDDLVLGRPSRFGLGFQLTQPERPIGRTPSGFGHFGAGGSVGFCDPDESLAFAYVTSDMGPRWQNPRNRGLTEAVLSALG
jgi:CubicO group peptidase (beta-lactamase class C family)